MRRILLAAFLLACAALPAKAQQSFSPNGKYASLTATNSTSATTTLPQGAVVGIFNTGAVPVSCNMDPVNAVATPNQIIVYSSIALTVGANTQIACIDQSGSTSSVVVLVGGSGVLSGGGGGGAGGGGAVTVANGADVTLGSTTDTPCALPASATACTIDQVEKAIANVIFNNLVALNNVPPTDCSGTITAGGTAQNAIAAQTTLHGFTLMNIDTVNSSEPLWFSFTGTAAASTAASYPLQGPTVTTFATPGSFTTPFGFGTNHAVSIVGATTGHKFSCTWW